MAQTYFGSTVRAGSGTLTDTTDGGFMVLTQTTTATTVSAGTAVTSTITIPADSQIIQFFIDCTTTPVVGGGTATAVNATIGTAAAGTFTTVGATTGNITTVNATTVDSTNLEVTNLKAKDGTDPDDFELHFRLVTVFDVSQTDEIASQQKLAA